jgi:transitional endoplasmic reticulum ATPase
MEIEQLRQAVQLSPHNIPLLLLFGTACTDAWNLEEALAAYERVLTQEPGNVDAQTGIAGALFKMGKLTEAVVRLEALLAKSRLSPAGLLLYSRILLAQNHPDQANDHYRHAITLDSRLADKELEQELTAASPPIKPEPGRLTNSPAGAENDINDILNSIEEKSGSSRRTTFSDVGGMEEVKEQIRMRILYPIRNRTLFAAYGKKAGGGVLLYGPPGCGKTLISRAIAGEIEATFFNIGIHQILDMYIGNSEKNLHEIFEHARGHAPAVLFIDEVDALASDRSLMKMNGARTMINQFLAEMDGVDTDNENVLIMAATNAPWHLDPAFKRPGRFDRMIFVPPPDTAGRTAILSILLKGKPAEGIDAAKIAEKTEGFSGADLSALVETATESVLERAMKTDRIIPVTNADCLAALKKLKPSTKAWFETAKNYALFSNQSGFYDDVLPYLGMKK